MFIKMAPSFANLFLGFFEANALKNAPFQAHTWLHYIDDIFMIWTEGLDNLKIFLDYLNNIPFRLLHLFSSKKTKTPNIREMRPFLIFSKMASIQTL